MNGLSEKELLQKIDPDRLPKHIAIIMDGNGRWAKKRNMPRISGHRAGMKSVRRVVEGCHEIGIEVLTLYAFSTENWQRPSLEVSLLMRLLRQYLRSELKTLKKNNIRLSIIGEPGRLPESVRDEIERVGRLTEDNSRMTLNLALNYGGRQEILRAVRKLMNGNAGDTVGEDVFSNNLFTAGLPDPDLLVRTSGEQRISNFLLWQIAYTELYFTDTLWPDFTKADLYKAVLDYQKRERRYGGI